MRKSPDWFVYVTLGALTAFCAAVLIGSAISGASAAEKTCLPFDEGVDAVVGAAKIGNGKLTVVPPKNMKRFSAAMAKAGYPLTGDSVLLLEMPDGSEGVFVKHAKKLCIEGFSRATKPAEAPPAAAPPADAPDQDHPHYEGEERL